MFSQCFSGSAFYLLTILATLLHQCGTTLQSLGLWGMNLQPVEKELDELLEVLVSHHQEGRAHGKLMLDAVRR